MGSVGPKHLVALAPAVVLALVGLGLLVFSGRVVDGVVILALAGLLGGLSYLALIGRRLVMSQQQLVRRLGRVERLDKRAIALSKRTLRSGSARAGRVQKQAGEIEERNSQRLIRLEKLLLAQQQEISDALAGLARRLESQADAAVPAPGGMQTSPDSDRASSFASVLETLTRSVRDLSEESRLQLLAIKRHLRALEDGEHGGSLRKNLDADVAALIAVNRQVGGGGTSLPVPSKWALSPQVLELAVRLVRTHPDIDLVVELGSGVSTSWIADVLRSRGRGRVVSLEHDPDFLALTRQGVVAAGVEDFVDLRLAPLVDVELGNETFTWYDYAGDLDGVGLLLVDGPPGGTGPDARYPALPVFHASLRDGAFVILDDASRDDEQRILDRWLGFESDGVSVTLVEMVDRAALLRVSRKA